MTLKRRSKCVPSTLVDIQLRIFVVHALFTHFWFEVKTDFYGILSDVINYLEIFKTRKFQCYECLQLLHVRIFIDEKRSLVEVIRFQF